MISISEIQKNPYQPRKEFDTDKLKELAQSIKENGLIQLNHRSSISCNWL